MLDKNNNDSLSQAFDLVIPKKENTVISVPFNELRITIAPQFKKNCYFDCINEDKYAQFVFIALRHIYHDVQVNPEKYYKSTLVVFSKALTAFIPWLIDHEVTELNRYKIIKDFETYRVNDLQLKTSMVDKVLQMLKLAIPISTLDIYAKNYLTTLIKGTKLSFRPEREQQTVTAFFGQCLWLRSIVGNDLFSRVESPKRLMNSFSVTIASTLITLQTVIEKLEEFFIEHQICASDLQLKGADKESKTKICKTGVLLLSRVCRISKDGFEDILSELLFYDLVSPQCAFYVKQQLISGEAISLQVPERYAIGGVLVCRKPIFFDEVSVQLVAQRAETQWRNNVTQDLVAMPITHVENMFFSYLCAWLTIQQSDIDKLTENDFRFVRNKRGRVTHLSCIYYKGRARGFKETLTISTSRVEGEAIFSFIQKRKLCSLPSNNLVEIIGSADSCSKEGRLTRMFYLWSVDGLKAIIEKQLQQRQYSSVFMSVMTALILNHGETYAVWRPQNKQLKSADYWTLVKNPVPLNWFSFNMVKNSAVHARTDMYREGHLINKNSHDNKTEKSSYLSQENKEWVNQHGRITRLVMVDIANTIYKPSLDAVKRHTADMQIRTEIVTATDGQVNEIGVISNIKNKSFLPDAIVVIDSVVTVCLFNHYIAQAEEKYEQLLHVNIEFVEKTMLPTVEWMAELLATRFLKENVKKGGEDYENLKHNFPSLFDAQIIG